MSEVLKKENIILNCKPAPKDEVIRAIGAIMVKEGMCTPAYVEGMLAKEKVFNTYMGNQVALPHGIEEVRSEVRETGIVMMVFPEATVWGNDMARLVIGIAAKGDEHVGILSQIAMYCLEEENVNAIVESSADEIYSLFAKGENV